MSKNRFQKEIFQPFVHYKYDRFANLASEVLKIRQLGRVHTKNRLIFIFIDKE